MRPSTKEPQYNFLYDIVEKQGLSTFGLMANAHWKMDPKKILITMSRYKFVAKMLSGKKNVLEIGCADGFYTRLVQQEVEHITAADFDPLFIGDAQKHLDPGWPIDFVVHDILNGALPGHFDAAYCLDVLEHIPQEREDVFFNNIKSSLLDAGVLIVGIPSLESQAYASPQSKEGHVNCMSGNTLRDTLGRHFKNVFMFSMNDEVLHTGYFPMSHYLFGICCGKFT